MSNMSLCSSREQDQMEASVKEVKKRPAFTTTGSLFDEEPNADEGQLSVSWENLLEAATSTQKTRRITGMLRKFPQPAPRSIATEDPLSNTSWDDLSDAAESPVELQPVQTSAHRREDEPPESKPDSEQGTDELMEWWDSVKGWRDWNETLQQDDEEAMVEQAADRVYLAARLFVHLFNQRGASLQRRILELLSLADAADHFHKKTVSAAVGGGVASVAGSLATITGLILAPFTFGASVIVTAVGISVATAGGITSATANITDTVHSRMDRKKVEKMIQGYQEEIRDIRECLEFVQEGMDILQEWNFEQYSQSAAKKALNHSVKTVMRAGGSAGRALIINTEKLISTVQILGAAGGAVKAAKVISVTTGVMSALFLALDVFFLAKDSHELRKGAKTQFAAKIREVCRDLQHGLLELNKVKTQLQKTMDGIEVEVEVEDDFKWDPERLEQELELLEEKLDVEQEKKREKSMKAAGERFEISECEHQSGAKESRLQSRHRRDAGLNQTERDEEQGNAVENFRREGGEVEETRCRSQDGDDQTKETLGEYRPRSNALSLHQ